MALERKPSGAYDAAYPISVPGGGTAYASARVLLDASGNPVAAASPTLPAGTDRSGTITTGGTAQQLAPANPNRKFLRGQNQSTGDLWIREVTGTASAAPPSYRVTPGSTYSVNTNQEVSIWGATTGQAWSATEG